MVAALETTDSEVSLLSNEDVQEVEDVASRIYDARQLGISQKEIARHVGGLAVKRIGDRELDTNTFRRLFVTMVFRSLQRKTEESLVHLPT